LTGIPIIQYAKNVIIAPFYYLPEALTVEAAIPWVVSKKTKTLKIIHAEWTWTAIEFMFVKS